MEHAVARVHVVRGILGKKFGFRHQVRSGTGRVAFVISAMVRGRLPPAGFWRRSRTIAYHGIRYRRRSHDSRQRSTRARRPTTSKSRPGPSSRPAYVAPDRRPLGAYRRAFFDFDVARVARFDDADVARVLETPGVLRSPRKVRATVANARALMEIEHDSASARI